MLGSPVVVGRYVFVTTTEARTFARNVEDGSIVWRLRFGKYTPVIATEQTISLLVQRPADGLPRPRLWMS